MRAVKLALCIVHNCDKARVTAELVQAGYKFTLLNSTGGFLGEANATLLIGFEEEDQDALFDLIRANCQAREQVVNVASFEASPAGGFIPNPVKVPVGGAVIFVVDVERFERF
jgi:uncharacterized protein YaaQ